MAGVGPVESCLVSTEADEDCSYGFGYSHSLLQISHRIVATMELGAIDGSGLLHLAVATSWPACIDSIPSCSGS